VLIILFAPADHLLHFRPGRYGCSSAGLRAGAGFHGAAGGLYPLFCRLYRSCFPKISYAAGNVHSLRLYGFYYENKSDFGKAIDYYLQSLYEARKIDDAEDEASALTDLAIVYTQDLRQPQKAKEVYLECVKLNKKRGDAISLINTYNNLGAIYNSWAFMTAPSSSCGRGCVSASLWKIKERKISPRSTTTWATRTITAKSMNRPWSTSGIIITII